MATYLNPTGLSLSMAVYLATDHYDHIPNVLSATSLLKSTRQVVLTPRVPKEQSSMDILSFAKSRQGTSIHDGLEKAWLGGHYKRAMAGLGYDKDTIERIVINPDPKELQPNDIPVYMEQRLFREIMGQTISGKFDFIGGGRVEDLKTTSVYTWIYGTKDEDYQLQGSIYRWLDQGERITEDNIAVQFWFTDWKAANARTEKHYPPESVITKEIPLLSLDDTETFIRDRLTEIAANKDQPEQELPLCTDKQLWRSATIYKVKKTASSPKAMPGGAKFDNPGDAYAFAQQKGGVVIEVPGAVKACNYCPAFVICTQKDRYIADGSLKI
jgi:hypothetical protein